MVVVLLSMRSKVVELIVSSFYGCRQPEWFKVSLRAWQGAIVDAMYTFMCDAEQLNRECYDLACFYMS